MKFELKEKNGFIPNLVYGNKGSELACFIPDGVPWTQANYGQGEGQVIIENNEWGFYFGDDAISVVLHEGSLPFKEAYEFVSSVSEKIFLDRKKDVSINLVGTG